MKKSFVLEGGEIQSVDDFYDEVQRVLCPRFKGFGRNWHAFRDILEGGFLEYEKGEDIDITIKNSKKMKKQFPESQFRKIIKYCEEASNVTLFLE